MTSSGCASMAIDVINFKNLCHKNNYLDVSILYLKSKFPNHKIYYSN